MSVTHPLDRAVGQAIANHRKSLMTQSQLAAAMTEFGLPMTQQTFVRIEGGARSLRLIEAASVASILNVTLNDLMPPELLDDLRRSSRQARVDAARQRLAQAEADLAAAENAGGAA